MYFVTFENITSRFFSFCVSRESLGHVDISCSPRLEGLITCMFEGINCYAGPDPALASQREVLQLTLMGGGLWSKCLQMHKPYSDGAS